MAAAAATRSGPAAPRRRGRSRRRFRLLPLSPPRRRLRAAAHDGACSPARRPATSGGAARGQRAAEEGAGLPAGPAEVSGRRGLRPPRRGAARPAGFRRRAAAPPAAGVSVPRGSRRGVGDRAAAPESVSAAPASRGRQREPGQRHGGAGSAARALRGACGDGGAAGTNSSRVAVDLGEEKVREELFTCFVVQLCSSARQCKHSVVDNRYFVLV